MVQPSRSYVARVQGETVGQLLLRYLKLEDVRYIFGIPGGGLAYLLEVLKDDREHFQYVICRQETGAAYIADGYHRVTGTLGVVMVTTGPGATNALTGAMNAQNDGSAMLVITGEVDEHYYGKGYLQEGVDAGLNINAIYTAATNYSATISSQANFQTLLTQALRDAQSIPRRAVHLSMPVNVTQEVVADIAIPVAVENYRAMPQSVPINAIEQALQLLLAAKRPLIFLGNGCRRAFGDQERSLLLNFVERYGIPVMTTADAKGVFPENHPLSLRVYGFSSCLWAQYYLDSQRMEEPEAPPYDALLVMASSLNDLATNKWHPMLVPNGPLIQIDLDQSAIARAFHVALGIVGEVGAAVHELSQMSSNYAPNTEEVAARKAWIARIKNKHPPFYQPEWYESTQKPIQPAAVVRVMQEVLPKDAIVMLDAGNCVGWGIHYLVVDPPMQCHSSLAMGPMGFGVGAIVGAKIAAPERTCVALVGDGAFMMQGAEVSTAKQYGVGAIWIVLYDNDLNMVSQGQENFFPDAHSPGIWSELYQLGQPNLISYAKGLGAEAHGVKTPEDLEQTLKTAIDHAAQGKPQVIIAHIDRQSVPPYYIKDYAPPSLPKSPQSQTLKTTHIVRRVL
ncbi:thiamine pyrophosphate-binding protein [Trichocoleus sp. FACHB-591]|uniref:thiamine pyrophosphate-binding protein n=1 Tax=Trichocoleus sp. FACHB-591 TaxID=2692872 RepID=UPI0016870CFF|nr:thiamine pyrophosphate-binding protein [Trichocoleus sp. FACHB-591]MBD2098595.1 thiamine pyrophosphate-binding protein [Trichocoleus sp. FACHB-591]